jgi:hypothetical protein
MTSIRERESFRSHLASQLHAQCLKTMAAASETATPATASAVNARSRVPTSHPAATPDNPTATKTDTAATVGVYDGT